MFLFSNDFSIWYELSTGRTTLGWYQSYLTQKYKFSYHECGQSFGHLCLMITVCVIFCRTNENCCSWKTLSGNLWSVNVALNLLKFILASQVLDVPKQNTCTLMSLIGWFSQYFNEVRSTSNQTDLSNRIHVPGKFKYTTMNIYFNDIIQI